ncbi:MAG: helix-turn-helix domain-containing protein [Propionibacteriaceae bacterium]|nr:helix-turn-helix domain-containing protein [Propionibacteriaceae bacterium]
MSQLVSVSDAARRLGVTRRHVIRLIHECKLPASKLGPSTSAYVLAADDIDAYARGERPIPETVSKRS